MFHIQFIFSIVVKVCCILRPNIGDRFKVQGAKRWKKYKDINEVVYGGEVQTATGTSDDGVEIGTLVFVCDKNWYLIKANEDHIYYCQDRIDNEWRTVPFMTNIGFMFKK